MWRLARVWRRQRDGGVRAGLAQLPSPQLHRPWNVLSGYSAQEKRELLAGAWRSAQPVQLVTDPHDRDRGGFTQPVAFASDEAAEAFLREESEEDAKERTVPTLQAAHEFFLDLARSADEEVDVQNLLTSRKINGGDDDDASDEARRAEERDVHRHFFMDYYVQQGLIEDSEDERFALAEAMLTPCRALFQVNTEHALQRLVVRDQLERHQRGTSGECVFRTSAYSPLIFEAGNMPPQGFDEPARLPYSAATSPLAQRAALQQQQLSGADTQTALLPSSTRDHEETREADVSDEAAEESALQLHAMLQEEGEEQRSTAAVARTTGDKKRADICADSNSNTALCIAEKTPSVTPDAQPTLLHVQWLQRQMASDGLVMLDALSPLLCLVAYRAACPAQRHEDSDTNESADKVKAGRPRLVLDLYGAQANAAARHPRSQAGQRVRKASLHCSYYRDMAHHIWEAKQQQQQQQQDCEAGRVAVAVVLPGHVRRSSHEEDKEDVDDDDDVAHDLHITAAASRHAAAMEALPLDDYAADILFLQRNTTKKRRRRRRTGKNVQTKCDEQEEDGEGEEEQAQENDCLRGACDVVLCTPPTTEDGLRPRGVLALGHGAQSAHGEEGNAVDAFVHVCAAASEHFRRLCRQLTQALRYARRDGGWVIYATHSLNPIENEAVVCATLTAMQQANSANETKCEVECVPLHAAVLQARLSEDERRLVAHYVAQGQEEGRSCWTAIEGGAAEQDVQACDPRVVRAVAAAAWRSRPVQTGSDGLFMMVLRVSRTAQKAMTAASDDVQDAHEQVCAAGYTVSVQPRTKGREEHPGFCGASLLSSAAHHWATRVLAQPQSGWHVVQAGVPIGTVPANTTSSHGKDCSGGVPWHAVQLSSAMSNTAAAAQLLTMSHETLALPRAVVSAHMLCELLRLQTIRSYSVQRRLRELRRMQASQPLSREACELRDFMAAMATLCEQCTSAAELHRGGTENNKSAKNLAVCSYSVLLQPHMSCETPNGNATADTNAQAAEQQPQVQLHPAVVAELAATCVLARLDVHGSSGSEPAFVLSLHVPAAMPQWQAHATALEQLRLGLRDALLYVQRQVHGNTRDETFALADDTVRAEREEEEEEGGDAEAPVRLREDEYSMVDHSSHVPSSRATNRDSDADEGDVTSWLSSRDRARTTRTLRGLRRQLQAYNFGDGASVEQSDWVREVNYRSPPSR